MNELIKADFPALLGPKTKQLKTFLSVFCFLRSAFLLLVRWRAEAGSPRYPMYIKLATVFFGSISVIRAHCNHTFPLMSSKTDKVTNWNKYKQLLLNKVEMREKTSTKNYLENDVHTHLR